ncbi:MMPL family transporter [Hoylesella marshii]|uniref:MMPL family transporter n=1 Tax=Hoylesella marshii TaxID=189722 RepID=UPI000B2266B0|nr:MMPL family transporter [Hoylesella marshii]
MIDSPYGASETAKNTKLIERIDSIASVIGQSMTDVQILTTGAPVIAVQNAEQIKTDGLWTVSIAIILIVSLLFYSLRSWRHILLIVVAIAFGWLLALAGMSLIHRQVSIIVLGIASIIIGIAVNYPLHFVAHLSHRPSPRDTLRDLIEPLVIGNVTTVGAFCALIPLNSVALRDLGIFAAFMLVGTILFVTVFLPHLCHIRTKAKANGEECAEDADEYTPVYPRNKWIITAFVGLTLLLGYFSMSTAFDTNMQNINYLSADQRHLLADLAVMRNEQAGTTQVYMANEGTTPDQALEQSEADGADAFITSRREQQRRIDRWNAFLTRHQTLFRQTLPQEAARNGFSTDAFADFYSMLQTPFHPHDIRFFAPLIDNGIGTRIIGNTAVHIKNIPNAEVPQLIDRYGNADGSRWAFDVKSMNSTIASSLSDNFNYIGWACGLIVFIFLWLSFGKIEHALIAFLPMAVSWIWILGTMHILGMSFNLVNIILATFIFGQGDDYSIFMTEGLLYEHTHHRRMLASYKRSIFLSATIMFIGMGTLVIARIPPCLHWARLPSWAWQPWWP